MVERSADKVIKDPSIFNNIDKRLLARFKNFHKNNPDTFRRFKLACFQLKKMGKVKYSAECILQKIRWDIDIKTFGKEVFKFNSDYCALYARLMIYNHPEFKDFFELRVMKPFNRKLSGEEKGRSIAAGEDLPPAHW